MRALLMAAVAAFALAACDARTEYPVIDAPEYDTSIGPGGAAGISAPLAFDVDAIGAATSAYSVATAQDQVEGQPFTAITLSAGDEEVFRIYPTHDNARIHAISTRSWQARGPDGETIGAAAYADAAAADTAFCLEEHNGSGEFACSTAEDGRFWRIYESGALRRADAKLVEMRWIAPR